YLVPQSPVLHMPFFNQCRAVVLFSKELLQYSEEKLVEKLLVQKVVKVDSEAHPISSTECERFRLKREILYIHTRDKESFAEARSAETVSSHGDSYVQVLSRHKARQTVTVTSSRESS
ncbi:hypothetical protein Hamer_G002397, partial [Homarus americanus]